MRSWSISICAIVDVRVTLAAIVSCVVCATPTLGDGFFVASFDGTDHKYLGLSGRLSGLSARVWLNVELLASIPDVLFIGLRCLSYRPIVKFLSKRRVDLANGIGISTHCYSRRFRIIVLSFRLEDEIL